MSRIDENVSSTFDMGFGSSDNESTSSQADQAVPIPKDYWFGRKYFECVMAQSLLHRTQLYENVADIDSKLEAIIRLFPYRQCLEKLQVQGLAVFLPDFSDDVHEAYRMMLTCIGAIARKGTREEKAALLVILRAQSKIGVPSGSRENGPAVPESNREKWGGSQVQRSASDRSLSTSTLGQYSAALKEYGDQHDFVPVYVVQSLSTVPPKSRAIVSFKDYTFESIARNRKQARHQAAREACEFLKIQV